MSDRPTLPDFPSNRMTAGAAALLALLRLVSPHMFGIHEATEILLIVGAASATGVVGVWTGLGGGKWGTRLIVLAVFVAVGSSLAVSLGNFRQPAVWLHSLKYQSVLAMFAMGTAVVFREYGWRLMREKKPTATIG